MPRRSRAVISPEPPRLEEELAPLTPEAVDSGARIERALIEGAELTGVRASGVSLTEARLADVDLSGARLSGLRLIDAAVERGNLANLVAPELSLRRVVFGGARLTGAQWPRGAVTDVVLRDCRIDLATFAGTTFERTVFDGCMLVQVDFREALLRSVRFDDCDLTEADLTGVRIDGCELRGCTIDRLVGLERLRGAAMPWSDVVGNAGALASALGIRVLEER